MTVYRLSVFRGGTEISKSFCETGTVTEVVVDDSPPSGTNTYTFKVGVDAADGTGPGFTGNVGFARMTATVHKK